MSQLQKVLREIFIKVKILCFDWGRYFDPPRTHQRGDFEEGREVNISTGNLEYLGSIHEFQCIAAIASRECPAFEIKTP